MNPGECAEEEAKDIGIKSAQNSVGIKSAQNTVEQ